MSIEERVFRPRLHRGTRQIRVRINNRADSVCVYTALPYPDRCGQGLKVTYNLLAQEAGGSDCLFLYTIPKRYTGNS